MPILLSLETMLESVSPH